MITCTKQLWRPCCGSHARCYSDQQTSGDWDRIVCVQSGTDRTVYSGLRLTFYSLWRALVSHAHSAMNINVNIEPSTQRHLSTSHLDMTLAVAEALKDESGQMHRDCPGLVSISQRCHSSGNSLSSSFSSPPKKWRKKLWFIPNILNKGCSFFILSVVVT